MTDWHIINEKLRKDLFSLGLRDDEDGYWYIGQWDEWIMASYSDSVRIVEELFIDKNEYIFNDEFKETLLNFFK